MKNSLIIVALAVALFQVYAEGNVYNGFVDPLDRFAAGSLEFNNGDIYGNGDVNRALRRLSSETKVDEKGNVFEGKFDDLTSETKIFKGKITVTNGDVMEGKFHIEGSRYLSIILWKGSIYFSNGDTLEDYTSKWGGKGTIRYADGGVFKGEIGITGNTKKKPYKIKGVYVSKEGVRYKGRFSDYLGKLKTGWGTIKYPNGDVYEGEWNSKTLIPVSHTLVRVKRALRRLRSKTKVDEKGNVFKGKFDHMGRLKEGKITLANGDVMEGKFKHFPEFRLGSGSINFSNGDTLEDYKHTFFPRGTIRYADGGVFRGKIRLDFQAHTYKATLVKLEGEYVSKEGVRYTGKFYRRLGMENGTIEYPNGDVYKGEWDSNTLIPVSHTLVRVN